LRFDPQTAASVLHLPSSVVRDRLLLTLPEFFHTDPFSDRLRHKGIDIGSHASTFFHGERILTL